jgi:hypothetical protein
MNLWAEYHHCDRHITEEFFLTSQSQASRRMNGSGGGGGGGRGGEIEKRKLSKMKNIFKLFEFEKDEKSSTRGMMTWWWHQ